MTQIVERYYKIKKELEVAEWDSYGSLKIAAAILTLAEIVYYKNEDTVSR